MTDPLREPIRGAPNFTLHELIHSDKAMDLGLDNMPDADSCARLILIAQEIAQPARDASGPIRVSSGFRSAVVNLAVGGSVTSAHQFGAALDLVPTLVSAALLALWISENCPVFDQVIYEHNSRGSEWVHVSLYPACDGFNRRELRRHFPQDGNKYPLINRAQLETWAEAGS